MSATIIDGKAVAARITEALKDDVAAFRARAGQPPRLAVLLVGDNPASAVYVRNKARMAETIGLASITKTLPADADHSLVAGVLRGLIEDPSVHGILVQLPLPAHLPADDIIAMAPPEKDVDGFHPVNAGLLALGRIDEALIPCTPAGSILLAKEAMGADLTGARAVVIGRSNIVGKPVAQLLLAEHCTVTIAHSRTRDLPALAREADILVAAVGRAEMVEGDWIKPGATVIDVGINRVDAPEKGDGKTKLVGDVAFAQAREIAGAITPVPGGVGPMTIAMLMKNTLTAAQRQAR